VRATSLLFPMPAEGAAAGGSGPKGLRGEGTGRTNGDGTGSAELAGGAAGAGRGAGPVSYEDVLGGSGKRWERAHGRGKGRGMSSQSTTSILSHGGQGRNTDNQSKEWRHLSTTRGG